MIGTLRKCRICTRGGILAAILVAAVFATSQVACLTHTHCDGADCFDQHEQSHHDHDDPGDCGCEADQHGADEHHDHDIHHHSHDGKTHPKRRFTAPAVETACADMVSEETPVFTLVRRLPVVDESPPFEIYGLIFAERAPPLS